MRRDAVGREQEFRCLRLPVLARGDDRAGRLARARAVLSARGFQHVAAESADRASVHRRRACVAPADSGSARCDWHRRRRRPRRRRASNACASASRRRSVAVNSSRWRRMSSSVRASAAVSGPPRHGNRCREIAAAQLGGGLGERLQRPHDASREQQRRHHGNQAQEEHGPPEPPHETGHDRVALRGGQARLQQRDPFARRCEQRRARSIQRHVPRCGRATISARDKRRGVQRLEVRLDVVEPVRQTHQPHPHAGLLGQTAARARASKNVSVTRRVSTRLGTSAIAPCRPSGCQVGRKQESIALFGTGFERIVPGDVGVRAADDGRADHDRAVREAGALQARRRNNSSCARLPARISRCSGCRVGEPTRRRQVVLADATDFFARRDACQLHARQRLLLGLLAQQADRTDGQHARSPRAPARRASAPASARATAARREPPQAGKPFPQRRRHRIHQPVRLSARHSTKVLMTSVTIASSASIEATAKAATKRYSL